MNVVGLGVELVFFSSFSVLIVVVIVCWYLGFYVRLWVWMLSGL